MINIIHKTEKGVTLIEMLVVITILSMVVIGLGSTMRAGTDVWQTENTHTELLQNALIGLDKMTRELKQATEITSVSNPSDTNGYIAFRDVNGNNNGFQYNSNYAEYGNLLGTPAKLAGPITSLKFTCYGADGVITYSGSGGPIGLKEIRLVRIDMVARESGSTISVPVSSMVSVGNEDRYMPNPLDFAMYGDGEIRTKNNIWIGSHPTRYSPPANISTLDSAGFSNNGNIYGNISAKNAISIINGSYAGKNLYSGGNVTIENNADVVGDVFVYGNITNNGDVAGHIYPLDLPNFTFVSPLPGPSTFVPGTVDIDHSFDGSAFDQDHVKNGSVTLYPGSYRNIDAKDISNLVLSINPASPLPSHVEYPTNYNYFRYDFESIGPSNKNLNINITNLSSTIGIQIFLHGNLNLANLNMTLNDPNRADMVYVESLSNINAGGQWIGTFFTSGNPQGNNANIYMDKGPTNDYWIRGALYARGIAEFGHSGSNEPNPLGNKIPELTFVPPSKYILPSQWDPNR